MKFPLRKNDTHLILRGALALTTLFAASALTFAQEKAMIQASFANNQQPVKVDVLVGQTRVLDFDQEFDRVSISDPKIAEAVPISFRQVLVNGLKFGQVNLVAWSKEKPSRMLVFDIFVQANISLIDNQIKVLFPKENIQLSQANESVVLSGTVTRPEFADQAQKIIEAAGMKVTNLLKSPVMDALQVQLQIRVAEVNRTILREVATAYGVGNSVVPAYINSGGPAQADATTGINVTENFQRIGILATSAVNILLGNPNGDAGVLGFVRALHTRGAIRQLAEPNLIAMNGQKASFLAGGEFPIPLVQNISGGQSSVTIFFKEFGVRLTFTPTIIDENHIRLELEPEVSAPDFSLGIRLQGFVIPGLITRKAKTSLELRDGQSFALAGLIDNREQVNLSKVPLLADIPILGELFKSRSFQRNETELLFLATVKMVEPLNPDQLPRLPGVSELKPVGSAAPAGAVPSSSIEGQSGHSVPPRKSDGGPEAENKPKAEKPDSDQPNRADRVDRGATANLQSKVLPPIAPAGPVGGEAGGDSRAPKPESKPDAGKPKPKEPKAPQQGSEKQG
ncbi:MAG: pilus assembly protein N-terminal domain-containing protein [Blastocatellia bacterium]